MWFRLSAKSCCVARLKMLQPFMHVLNAQRIVLASGSPRRRDILRNVGLKFEVVQSTFEENLNKSSFAHPSEYVKETARCKTLEVAQKLSSDEQVPNLVIGADTVVTMNNKIYEKPRSREEAVTMLQSFSGGNHQVYTGVVIVSPSDSTDITTGDVSEDGQFRVNTFHEATEVHMATMTPEIINAYVDTGEPMDKAGGYGIQAIGGTLVESIKGDYFNVMGFPLHRFTKVLVQLYSQNKKQQQNT